jgi:hypothetical protein
MGKKTQKKRPTAVCGSVHIQAIFFFLSYSCNFKKIIGV